MNNTPIEELRKHGIHQVSSSANCGYSEWVYREDFLLQKMREARNEGLETCAESLDKHRLLIQDKKEAEMLTKDERTMLIVLCEEMALFFRALKSEPT